MQLKEQVEGTMLVKAVLKGGDVNKFETIRKKHGVIHRSEVIRICINRTYESIDSEKTLNPKETTPQ